MKRSFPLIACRQARCPCHFRINYHPYNPTRVEELEVSADRDDFEFIELFNAGTSAIDLTGVRFELGINFTFP